MTAPTPPAFDLAAYREAHPTATAAEAREAFREWLGDMLHDQVLALLDRDLDALEVAYLQGVQLTVGVQMEVAPRLQLVPDA